MTKWEEAVKTFLVKWENRPEFEGAILSGSYAVGCPEVNSDIDVMMVLADGCGYWERGNEIINRLMVEYVADPVTMWRKGYEDNIKANSRVTISMWAMGKILRDKNGQVARLKEEADRLIRQPLNPMDERGLEMAKYHFYDRMEKLKSMETEGFAVYAPLYYLHLNFLIATYAGWLGVPLPAVAKIHKFLNDSDFRSKYQLAGFEDNEFVAMVNECLRNYSTLEAITKLTDYLTQKLGGFKIDGWKLRTEI